MVTSESYCLRTFTLNPIVLSESLFWWIRGQHGSRDNTRVENCLAVPFKVVGEFSNVTPESVIFVALEIIAWFLRI